MSEAVAEPPWLTAWRARPPVEPQRPPNGQFPPGVSGNPAGRPPGAKSKRTLLAEQFEEGVDTIVAVVKQKAMDGDLQAAGLVLSRAIPPKRAVAERTPFALDTTQPRHVQAQQIVAAVAAGELDSDAAKVLLDCLTAAAALHRLDAFEEQLAAMQAQLAAMHKRGAGGVVYFDPTKETTK